MAQESLRSLCRIPGQSQMFSCFSPSVDTLEQVEQLAQWCGLESHGYFIVCVPHVFPFVSTGEMLCSESCGSKGTYLSILIYCKGNMFP